MSRDASYKPEGSTIVTVPLDPALHKRLRIYAASEGRTIKFVVTQMIEDTLSAALATQTATGRTMGEEVPPALFDVIVSAVEEAANGICDPSESVERIVAALQNGGE